MNDAQFQQETTQQDTSFINVPESADEEIPF